MAKKTSKNNKLKFQYTPEYQWDLLRYIINDKMGHKALVKVRDHYFTLIEHQVIAYAIIEYYEKNHKIPGETILREQIITLLNSKNFVDLVKKDQQDTIIRLIPQLYQGIIIDGDEIYNMCKTFSQYVRIKELLEEIDPRDWNQYRQFADKFYNVIEDQDEQDNRKMSFLFQDIKERQFRRQAEVIIIPTPFRQLNALTNAGGYEIGSIGVILDKEKKGKTAALVNIAKGYVRQGKKVLYIDYENGMDSILIRFEQSIMGMDKKTILSGQPDSQVQKKFRKYKRIGGEVVVVRVPAGTNANDIQRIIDQYYREHGIRFEIIIADYLAKAGSISRKKDDTERISDAYEDFANLALRNKIEMIWTANHVTREGAKSRLRTRYESTDIAKCIDIVRHVHVILGLNRSVEEEEAGFLRFEVVEQRDGIKGRAVFTIDSATQQLKELSKAQRAEYDEAFAISLEDDDKPKNTPVKQEKIDKAKDDF